MLNQQELGEQWKCKEAPYSPDDSLIIPMPGIESVDTTLLCEGKRIVSDELQKVTLVAMHRMALQEGVPFEPSVTKRYPDVPEDANSDSAASWSPELKAYFQKAVYDPGSLRVLLNSGEKENNGAQGSHRIERNKLHLSILAKYAHNSSGSYDNQKKRLSPPFGFKSRIPDGFSDKLRAPPRREQGITKRAVFHNIPGQAIKKVNP